MRKEVVYDTFTPKQAEQRTPDWFKDRYGKFTASKIIDLLGIKGLGLTGETYAVEKAIEQLFGEVEEGFTRKSRSSPISSKTAASTASRSPAKSRTVWSAWPCICRAWTTSTT